MKLMVVRHGETIENAKGILMGHRQGTLSPLGKKQAKALGKKLSSLNFDAVYCSDLKRCRDTAKEIIRYHKKVRVEYSELLREKNLGVFENMPVALADFASLKGAYLTRKPAGGESHNDVKKRIREFLRFLKKTHPKESSILVVTHGGVIRAFKHILTRTDMRKILTKHGSAKNTGISEYTIDGRRVVEHCYNDDGHLNDFKTTGKI